MDPTKQEQLQEPDESKPPDEDSQQHKGSDAEKPPKTQQSQRSVESEESQEPSRRRAAISPRRLNIIVLGYVFTLSQSNLLILRRLWISLFLAALDSTIISTAVFEISNSFNSTSQSAWIVTAYLLTYNGNNPLSAP